MASIFTRIVNGELPSYKVAENENYYAFLDISPNTWGHTLVIPKREEDKIFNLSEEEYTGLMNFAYKVAKAIEKAIECERVCMAVIGFEVPHVHVHLIPAQTMGDTHFSKKVHCTEDDFKRISEKISIEFEA